MKYLSEIRDYKSRYKFIMLDKDVVFNEIFLFTVLSTEDSGYTESFGFRDFIKFVKTEAVYGCYFEESNLIARVTKPEFIEFEKFIDYARVPAPDVYELDPTELALASPCKVDWKLINYPLTRVYSRSKNTPVSASEYILTVADLFNDFCFEDKIYVSVVFAGYVGMKYYLNEKVRPYFAKRVLLEGK